MSTTLRGSHLIDDCTPSISYDPQVQAASSAFDRQMYEIYDDTGQVLFIPNIMGLTDSKLVDILAWQFHVDFYDATAPLEFRKQLVQNAIIWHKTKGTVALVNSVLDMFYPPPGSVYITEWFTYRIPFPPQYPNPGWHDRYRFRIIKNGNVVPDTEIPRITALIAAYKPISRWPEGETLASIPSLAQVFVCGYMLETVNMKSDPPPIRTDTYGSE